MPNRMTMMRSAPLRPIRGIAFSLACATLVCAHAPADTWNAQKVRLQVDPKTVLNHLSPSFLGLGYESSAVAQSNFFTAKNAPLVRLYRNLSPHGLIRIGGNVSDHTKYLPDGAAAPHTEREVTIINHECLVDLGGFARATGWKVMWGLNLGSGSPEEAVQEAVAVASALGNQLHSFELGNEVEALPRFKNSYAAYHAAFLEYKAAIRVAIPNAPFSGPDSIGRMDWITSFAETESSDIKLLTQHYYRGGAKDPASTIEKLLKPDEGWESRLAKLQEISREHGIPFRINEVNSCYGGGKPGVSDTFGSALWCLDYMFRLAAHGAEGINLETDLNQLGWISHYSPIVHDPTGNCTARPEYYGMLAFAAAGNGDLVKLTVDQPPGGINLSAYATKNPGGWYWITVVNKDLTVDAQVEIALPEGCSAAEAHRLSAPSAESHDQVTFSGAEVSADGNWTPRLPEKVAVKDGAARWLAPHASAVVVRLGP